MNKTTKALKLAEEALEELHYSSGTVKAVTLYKSALAAIRDALAEPVQKPWYEREDSHNANERAEPVKQEPVAWRWPTHNGYAYAETHFDDEGGEPLYAAPVRTKDLTDDEIYTLYSEPCSDREMVEFARAVIAADRRKNK